MIESRITVVVPVRNAIHFTRSLVYWLESERDTWHRAIIFDNGSTDGTFEWLNSRGIDGLEVRRRPESNIHEMWNEGWRSSVDPSSPVPCHVAILNNDIEFLTERALEVLSRALIENPRFLAVSPASSGMAYTEDPMILESNGIHGHALLIDAEKTAREVGFFDESFEVYYGDTDFYRRVLDSGFALGYVQNVSCHHHGGSTVNDPNQDRFDTWRRASESDKARFNEKHPLFEVA